MRITIQAVVDREDGLPPETFALGGVQREPDCDPSSGLGLFVRETHDMLLGLQSVVLKEQTALFLKSAVRCQGCGERLATKTTRSLVYRTAWFCRSTAALIRSWEKEHGGEGDDR